MKKEKKKWKEWNEGMCGSVVFGGKRASGMWREKNGVGHYRVWELGKQGEEKKKKEMKRGDGETTTQKNGNKKWKEKANMKGERIGKK